MHCTQSPLQQPRGHAYHSVEWFEIHKFCVSHTTEGLIYRYTWMLCSLFIFSLFVATGFSLPAWTPNNDRPKLIINYNHSMRLNEHFAVSCLYTPRRSYKFSCSNFAVRCMQVWYILHGVQDSVGEMPKHHSQVLQAHPAARLRAIFSPAVDTNDFDSVLSVRHELQELHCPNARSIYRKRSHLR